MSEPQPTTLPQRLIARLAGPIALIGLGLLGYGVVWVPFFSGERLVRTKALSELARPITESTEPTVAALAAWGRKNGTVPRRLTLDVTPADSPLTLISTGADYDALGGHSPTLIEFREESGWDGATSRREAPFRGRVRDPNHRSKVEPVNISIRLPTGSIQVHGVWDLEPGVRYALLLPVPKEARDDYRVEVRRRVANDPGRLTWVGLFLFLPAAFLWIGRQATLQNAKARASRSPHR